MHQSVRSCRIILLIFDIQKKQGRGQISWLSVKRTWNSPKKLCILHIFLLWCSLPYNSYLLKWNYATKICTHKDIHQNFSYFNWASPNKLHPWLQIHIFYYDWKSASILIQVYAKWWLLFLHNKHQFWCNKVYHITTKAVVWICTK